MGYRVKLGRIPKVWKDVCAQYKTEEEFTDAQGKFTEDMEPIGFEYYPPYRHEHHEELYEIGKYVSYDHCDCSKFYNFTIEEAEFWIMSKEGLKRLIDEYHTMIVESIENVDPVEYKRMFLREWTKRGRCGVPYYLDEERTDGNIVSSWKYEYAIFNLVYIYRTFDFEKDYLIYSGW
jgi:hypothetical protein